VVTRVAGSTIAPGLREEAESARTNFLGPDANGMWDRVEFTLDWSSESPVELWRRPIGAGWSSFAVDGGRAITQEQVEGSERVTCVDLLTGKEIWTQADEGVTFLKAKEGRAGVLMGGEGPRGTPTISADRVFVLGSTGIAKCLSFSDGKLLWQRNVITEFGGVIPKWGKSSSPLVLADRELVLFTGSDEPGATVVACDMASGETRWVYQGQGASYSTPRLLQIMGTPQVICVNQNDVASLDPSTGEELWRFEWKGTNPKVGQPILVGENRILVSASYGVGSPLIELRKDGGSWTTTRVWNSIRMKTKFSSVSVLGDLAFGLDEGRLAAISLEDGSKVWKREKFGFGQQLLVEDHLLVQTEPGDVVIGKVDEEQFTETGRIDALSSMTWNAPALAGRFLLVRNDREAVCYVLPRKRNKS
jgi:outer membrane protein assembly factor BamB